MIDSLLSGRNSEKSSRTSTKNCSTFISLDDVPLPFLFTESFSVTVHDASNNKETNATVILFIRVDYIKAVMATSFPLKNIGYVDITVKVVIEIIRLWVKMLDNLQKLYKLY